MTTETKSSQQIISEARTNWDEGSIDDAVMEWANCREASVRADGTVWICGPQRGHWLGSDELDDLVGWLRSNRMI